MEEHKESKEDEQLNIAFNYAYSPTNKLLILRIGVTILSVVVMFTNLGVDASFFKSLTIFAASQCVFVVGLQTKSSARRIFQTISYFIIGTFFIIGMLGLMHVVILGKTGAITILSFINFEPLQFVSFAASNLFWTMGLSIIAIYIIDWVTSVNISY